MALFTLEALEAKHGDCLILHYGPAESPSLILIDGGPDLVYKNSLQPRLQQIKDELQPDDPLPIEMLMVSHIDDDHVNGVLQFSESLVNKQQSKQPLPYEVRTLWHNSFDDILGNNQVSIFSSVSASVHAVATGALPPPGTNLSQPGAAVIASVGQGRDLRNHATKLKWKVNRHFKGLVSAPANGPKTIDCGNGLKLTVLGPRADRLKALQEEWDEILKKLKDKGDEGKAAAASYADRSVFNLSSIVVLAEMQHKGTNKRILLTGDGRGDDILDGLESAGFLMKDGTFHVDVLKLPHHGSSRNVKEDFFRRVTADHYVASGNGKYKNPKVETLEMISKARGNADFVWHLTNSDGENDLGKLLTDFFDSEKQKGKKQKVIFRKSGELSLKVNLFDAVDY
jgi:hypothetical protein